MNLSGKKVLVCGLGRSGIASAILLKKLGAFVSASDTRALDMLDLSKLDGIKVFAGSNPDEIVLDQDLIILSPGISTDLPFLNLARQNNIPIWSELELAYRFCKMPILAITGTNGKTTTTSLVGQIAQNYCKESIIAGNIGKAFTEKVLDTEEEKSKNAFAVIEVSSYQLETINKFHPKVSAILNVTPDHMDRHKTFQNYCDAKAKIFSNQTEDDYLVLNFDDKVCKNLAEYTCAKVVFFSTKSKLCGNGAYLDGDKIKIHIDDCNEVLMDISHINLLGEHNLSNVLAAVAICVCAKIPLDIIRDTIINFKAVEHRLEFVRDVNGIKFYNDSKATNVDSALKALYSIKQPIILIGGGYDKKVDFYEWIKAFGNVKCLILMGEVKKKIAAQCDELGFNSYIILDDFNEAVRKSFEIAERGDCVLLSPACASWDMFDSFESRGNLFKQIVNSF